MTTPTPSEIREMLLEFVAQNRPDRPEDSFLPMATVLAAMKQRLGRPSIEVQQLVLSEWHDLMCSGYFAWGGDWSKTLARRSFMSRTGANGVWRICQRVRPTPRAICGISTRSPNSVPLRNQRRAFRNAHSMTAALHDDVARFPSSRPTRTDGRTRDCLFQCCHDCFPHGQSQQWRDRIANLTKRRIHCSGKLEPIGERLKASGFTHRNHSFLASVIVDM